MDQRFVKPVRIALGPAQNGIYTVEEAERAADLLSYEWPVRTGRRYTEARRACILAAEGQITAREVRQAFVAAAWKRVFCEVRTEPLLDILEPMGVARMVTARSSG